jgi:uncharacterized protein (UPF0333 family)
MKFTRLAASAGILLAAAGAGSLAGCSMFGGAKNKLSASPTIPAAESIVRFKRTSNDNTSIKLKVKHLANPEKLTPPAKNYVVWLSSNPTATPQNIGALEVDRKLTGTLDTVTALHSFKLFITAEASGQVQQPSEPPLLWTDHND